MTTPDVDSLDSLLERVQDIVAQQDPEQPAPAYHTLTDWVALWLLPIVEVRPRVPSVATEQKRHHRWCATWWRHPQVTAILNAMWYAWEAERQDPAGGMARWWRDCYLPLWSYLTSEDGPMRNCSPDGRCEVDPPLTMEYPPDHWKPAA